MEDGVLEGDMLRDLAAAAAVQEGGAEVEGDAAEEDEEEFDVEAILKERPAKKGGQARHVTVSCNGLV